MTSSEHFVGCSRSAVVSTYQQWSEEGQTTNQQQGVCVLDTQGSSMHEGNEGYPFCCAVADIFNDGNGGDVSQHTVHHTLLCMGLHSLRLVKVSRIMRPATLHTLFWNSLRNDDGFNILPWTPISPDLNSIKHLWDVLEQQVRSTRLHLTTYRTCC